MKKSAVIKIGFGRIRHLRSSIFYYLYQSIFYTGYIVRHAKSKGIERCDYSKLEYTTLRELAQKMYLLIYAELRNHVPAQLPP